MPRTLYRQRELALVFGAVSRNSSRNQLSDFGSKQTERLGVLVVDRQRRIGAETTHFAAQKATAALLLLAGFLSRSGAKTAFDSRLSFAVVPITVTAPGMICSFGRISTVASAMLPSASVILTVSTAWPVEPAV